MFFQQMSPSQIRRNGLVALNKALGPVGMTRFIQQYELGQGDYTKERNQWLDKLDLEEILSGLNDANKLQKIDPSL